MRLGRGSSLLLSFCADVLPIRDAPMHVFWRRDLVVSMCLGCIQVKQNLCSSLSACFPLVSTWIFKCPY